MEDKGNVVVVVTYLSYFPLRMNAVVLIFIFHLLLMLFQETFIRIKFIKLLLQLFQNWSRHLEQSLRVSSQFKNVGGLRSLGAILVVARSKFVVCVVVVCWNNLCSSFKVWKQKYLLEQTMSKFHFVKNKKTVATWFFRVYSTKSINLLDTDFLLGVFSL
jgi:hypothetical protein